MHAMKLLHKSLQTSCPSVHKKRLNSLMLAVESITHHQSLTVTGVGRHLRGVADVKHKIKQSDRLIGNSHLQEEVGDIYAGLIKLVLGSKTRPLILVDWSPCGRRNYQILSASIAAEGRSIQLYAEVHLEKVMNSPKIEKAFLKKLSDRLPKDCKPILVSDGGFKSQWFAAIEQRGWDWVGRIRSNAHFRLANKGVWDSCMSLYDNATSKPKLVGEVEFCKGNPVSGNMFLYKGKAKKRKFLNKDGSVSYGEMSRRHSKSQREPWLLFSSINKAVQVVNIYSKRMQIEEMFRDIKSQRNGFRLNEHNTKCIKRLDVMVLIAALASIVLWLIGLAAEKNGLHYKFQANTIRSHRVLSIIFLGKQVLLHCIKQLKMPNIREALADLQAIGA